MKVFLIGGSGYIGEPLFHAFKEAKHNIYSAGRHTYYDLDALSDIFDHWKPDLVVNAAAFIKNGDTKQCDFEPLATMIANYALPSMLAKVCEIHDTPLMHLSTGCLFNEDHEYDETEIITRGSNGPCGVYINSKIKSEQEVQGWQKSWILRIRLPFDNLDHPRNYLSKLAGFPQVYDHINSLTHRGEFVKAAVHLFETKSPYGIYHCANPGQVSAREITHWMVSARIRCDFPEIISHETTGCRLNVSKLLATGAKMSPVVDAVDYAIKNWVPHV